MLKKTKTPTMKTTTDPAPLHQLMVDEIKTSDFLKLVFADLWSELGFREKAAIEKTIRRRTKLKSAASASVTVTKG